MKKVGDLAARQYCDEIEKKTGVLTLVNGRSSSVMRSNRELVWCILSGLPSPGLSATRGRVSGASWAVTVAS